MTTHPPAPGSHHADPHPDTVEDHSDTVNPHPDAVEDHQDTADAHPDTARDQLGPSTPEEIARFDAVFDRALAQRPRQVPPRQPRPPARTTPIAVRFDEFTLRRLKAIASRRNKGYQTLLKEFVVERLYEEERREGIIES